MRSEHSAPATRQVRAGRTPAATSAGKTADNSSESRDEQVRRVVAVAAVIAIRLAYSVRRALRKDDVVLELSDDFVTLFSTVDYVFFVVSAKRWCWKRDNKYNIVSS